MAARPAFQFAVSIYGGLWYNPIKQEKNRKKLPPVLIFFNAFAYNNSVRKRIGGSLCSLYAALFILSGTTPF